MGKIKSLMLNAGVTFCLLLVYHTVIVGPSLNSLGKVLYNLEYEWRRSDKQIRQFYNTMIEKQNKINEDMLLPATKPNASQEQ